MQVRKKAQKSKPLKFRDCGWKLLWQSKQLVTGLEELKKSKIRVKSICAILFNVLGVKYQGNMWQLEVDKVAITLFYTSR
jgi:hypothetical protein